MSCLLNGPAATGNAKEVNKDENLNNQVSTLFPAIDIDLIMAQTNVCRCQAIKSLAVNQGDIVGAIMQLTT